MRSYTDLAYRYPPTAAPRSRRGKKRDVSRRIRRSFGRRDRRRPFPRGVAGRVGPAGGGVTGRGRDGALRSRGGEAAGRDGDAGGRAGAASGAGMWTLRSSRRGDRSVTAG